MHDYKLKTSPKITLLWVKNHARSPFPGVLPNTRRPEGLSGFFFSSSVCIDRLCWYQEPRLLSGWRVSGNNEYIFSYQSNFFKGSKNEDYRKINFDRSFIVNRIL